MDSMSAMKATSPCLNLVSITTIGLVKSGPVNSSWFSEFPANGALQSKTTLIFLVYFDGTHRDVGCTMSFQLVNHPSFLHIPWLTGCSWTVWNLDKLIFALPAFCYLAWSGSLFKRMVTRLGCWFFSSPQRH